MPLEGKKAVIVGQTEIVPGHVVGWLVPGSSNRSTQLRQLLMRVRSQIHVQTCLQANAQPLHRVLGYWRFAAGYEVLLRIVLRRVEEDQLHSIPNRPDRTCRSAWSSQLPLEQIPTMLTNPLARRRSPRWGCRCRCS